MQIALLILAAGASTRMKTPKQLLTFGESTLLELAINNARKSKADTVLCVLGAHADSIKKQINFEGVEVITNESWNTGISSSIVAGVNHLMKRDLDAILVTLADQPLINYTYLNELITQFKKHPQNIIASRYTNKKGVPALFPKSYFNTLLTLKGDHGAKTVLNTSLDVIAINPPENTLRDIDTPNDFQSLLNTWS